MSYSFSENQWGEKFIEEINRTDFSCLKSTDFFDERFDADISKDNTLFLVLGCDSGLLLPYLKQHATGRGSRIVVIEHDDIYPLVANEYRGLLTADEKNRASSDVTISLHSHSTWVEEVFSGSETPWLLGGKIELVESHSSSSDYSRLYMPILQAIKRSIEERVNEVSGTLSNKVFTTLQFKNAADNITPLKQDLDFGIDKVAVVLGGGPSLDLHLEWVKENRHKLFILSVSRIAKKLQEHDLKPDLLVSVDPQTFSYEVCKTGVLWADVPLVHNYHVSSELLQQWQGPTFYLGKKLPWLSVKDIVGNVTSSGPTVSHTAILVAANLGFSQILVTGVDMCYSQSVSTHAQGSPEQMIQQMPSLCNTQVETYSGRKAGTSIALKSCAVALENIGAMLNEAQPVLFNMSFEAAHCPSIPYIDFLDVKLPSNKPDFSLSNQPNEPESAHDELTALATELKVARHAFTKMRTLSTDAKKHVAGMHSDESAANKQKHASKLTRTRKQIQNDYSAYLTAILGNDVAGFAKTTSPIDFADMKPEELIEWGQKYYELIEVGAKSMIKNIDELQPRITLRQDELNADVDIRELAKRWREDRTPGRIMRWKQRYWQNVKPKDRAWVQRAIGKFRTTLNELDSSATNRLHEKNQNIDNVLRSLVFLSESRSQGELEAIESKLDAKQWPYSALKKYTAGLVCELEMDVVSTIANFQSTIDICSQQLQENTHPLTSMQRLLEDCLVRMTSAYIGIKDYPSAMSTLGMLSEMLPSYVVSYAKILGLCDQKEFAVQLLETYLELYPANKKARLLLTTLAPTPDVEAIGNNNPVYVRKISGAMQAILGENPEHAA